MERMTLAYLLIAFLAACAIGLIAYGRYNSRDRRYARQLAREMEAHRLRMAAQRQAVAQTDAVVPAP